MKNPLNIKSVQLFLTALLLSLTALFMYSGEYFGNLPGASISTALMLGTLGLGLLFFILDQRSLMMVSFSACAAVCVTIKDHFPSRSDLTNVSPRHAIKVAHLKIDDHALNADQVDWLLDNSNAHMVSVQGLNQTNFKATKAKLDLAGFEHSHIVEKDGDEDIIAVFSVYPISYAVKSDHFGTTNLIGKLKLPFYVNNEDELLFVSTYMNAQNDYSDKEEDLFKRELYFLANQINQVKHPLIVFGEYNAVSTNNNLSSFKQNARLIESRSEIDYLPPLSHFEADPSGQNHIFYSDEMKCISFETLISPSFQHSGVIGTYEFIGNEANSNNRQTPKEL